MNISSQTIKDVFFIKQVDNYILMSPYSIQTSVWKYVVSQLTAKLFIQIALG